MLEAVREWLVVHDREDSKSRIRKNKSAWRIILSLESQCWFWFYRYLSEAELEQFFEARLERSGLNQKSKSLSSDIWVKSKWRKSVWIYFCRVWFSSRDPPVRISRVEMLICSWVGGVGESRDLDTCPLKNRAQWFHGGKYFLRPRFYDRFCASVQGLHPSEEQLKANYVTMPHKVPNPKAPPDAADTFPSFWRMHRYYPSWPHMSQDSLQCLKKKKEREKMATCVAQIVNFVGLGGRNRDVRVKHLVTQLGNAPNRPIHRLKRLARSLRGTRPHVAVHGAEENHPSILKHITEEM